MNSANNFDTIIELWYNSFKMGQILQACYVQTVTFFRAMQNNLFKNSSNKWTISTNSSYQHLNSSIIMEENSADSV